MTLRVLAVARRWPTVFLDVLATTPVLVVCSGAKSVLDIGATLEALETRSVPVLGYRTDRFPAFYLRESAYEVPWRVSSAAEAAAVFAAQPPGRRSCA